LERGAVRIRKRFSTDGLDTVRAGKPEEAQQAPPQAIS
jgi:hypothetical protein